ncbi:MAG: metal dependent phosphohydrolase [Chloroflexi bacterium]|nr:metal dependent phosphohydrolase [Chloroflexota bacterium]
MLNGMGNRWRHVQGVAAKAQIVSEAFEGDDREHLVAAAHLHDIGYAPALRVTGLHQLDGDLYLRSLGHERLAGLVAHHSEARFELKLRGYADRRRHTCERRWTRPRCCCGVAA